MDTRTAFRPLGPHLTAGEMRSREGYRWLSHPTHDYTEAQPSFYPKRTLLLRWLLRSKMHVFSLTGAHGRHTECF